jgi:hypothetical protein
VKTRAGWPFSNVSGRFSSRFSSHFSRHFHASPGWLFEYVPADPLRF